jgi:hypothetical protein
LSGIREGIIATEASDDACVVKAAGYHLNNRSYNIISFPSAFIRIAHGLEELLPGLAFRRYFLLDICHAPCFKGSAVDYDIGYICVTQMGEIRQVPSLTSR